MSDTYQAVYDAVRSRLTNCDVGETVRSAVHLDGSHAIAVIQQELCYAAASMSAPSVLYRPKLRHDGDKWCAIYGDNLKEGIAGFGNTPAEAMAAFDKAWASTEGMR